MFLTATLLFVLLFVCGIKMCSLFSYLHAEITWLFFLATVAKVVKVNAGWLLTGYKATEQSGHGVMTD